MKKTIIILLTALLALSVFVACNQDTVVDDLFNGGGSERAASKVTITFKANGGTVTATGGSGGAAGIGDGSDAYTHGTLKIGTGMALYGDSTSPAQTKISDATDSYTGARYRYMLAKQPGI